MTFPAHVDDPTAAPFVTLGQAHEYASRWASEDLERRRIVLRIVGDRYPWRRWLVTPGPPR